MKRLVIQEIVKICAKSLFLATIIGIGLVIFGTFNHWNSPIPYSNAFFLAGCLLIIAGASSRFAAGQEIGIHQRTHTEVFRDMSRSEQALTIINSSSTISRVILGVMSGLWLILASAIAAYLL